MKKVFVFVFALATLTASFKIVRESLFGTPRESPILSGAQSTSRESPDSRFDTNTTSTERPRELLVPTNDMGPEPKRYPWQEKAARAQDFGDVVKEALPAASAGDADAQFAMYVLMRYCADGMRKRSDEELRQMHSHCDGLATEFSDLGGESDAWLRRAHEAAFPRALAFTALEELQAIARVQPKKAERERRVATARSDLLLALNSNDPAVTSLVAGLLPAFFPTDPRTEQAFWVWQLAACEQGLDCRPGTQFVRDDCILRNRCMSGESAQEYIRRVSGDFPSLTARARKLARSLRNSELDEKLFDETVTTLPASYAPSGPPPATKASTSSTPARVVR